ncbi:hypothetical protein [Pectobacterium versatile]|uniref:hypothetical protein n=1 Tax=Pectobacterium versatile TaxID=2488639 RepID=UPI001F2C8BAD|nr:hypothetical protein [Pectobacterium versatile]
MSKENKIYLIALYFLLGAFSIFYLNVSSGFSLENFDDSPLFSRLLGYYTYFFVIISPIICAKLYDIINGKKDI